MRSTRAKGVASWRTAVPRSDGRKPTTELTVSDPGKARIFVRDPRPLRPPARKRRNETQAPLGDVTFECYCTDVTVPTGMNVVCGST